MNIKSIVNNDVVNIDNCEGEPIHVPGSIQPHGFLLALDTEHIIQYCSENCTDFIKLSPNDILGRPYSAIFDCEDNTKLAAYLQHDDYNTSQPLRCSYNGVDYNVSIHYSNNLLLLEFEPLPDGRLEIPNLYIQTQTFISTLQKTSGLRDLCQSIAEEIRKVTGYDRVMVYRFDKLYNGEVYAEAKRDDLEGFLGLHYPHTDIPVQARQLYLQNMLRVIVDINYRPSPILTMVENASNQSLDLGNAMLRSVSPIHVEYLKNMGVGATLTISLIQDKRLWGLIACHHYSPKNIPHYIRLTALLEGNFLASQIRVREVADEYELTRVIDNTLQGVLHRLNNTDNIQDYINDPELLHFVKADGIAIIYDEEVYCNGITPSDTEVRKLANWFSDNKHTEVVTDHLSDIYPHAQDIAESTAGLMYFSLNKFNKNGIIWFRTEMDKTIHWAGEPDKAIIKDKKGLSPRKSFATWKQIVKGYGIEWSGIEVNAASKCVYALQKQFTLSDIKKEEEKQRNLSEKLKLVNEELSNINWIGSHDLKEPLRKIQVFASKMLDDKDYQLIPSSIDLVERMRRSAGRMQNLIDDILNYSRVSNFDNRLAHVDLDLVLNEVLTELEDAVNEKNVRIEVMKLPTINGIHFQLRQLFINLISNAIKFSKADVQPHIKITREDVTINGDKFHKIIVSDNGIGFSDKYESLIFKVFQRLNNQASYEGTGIGLAICRKVMEVHNGYIEASGAEGKGADFTVFFPAIA